MHFSLCFVWLCFAHIRQCPSSAHQGFCIPFRFVSHTAFPFMNRYTRKRMNEWISPVENISIYLSGPSLWSLPLPSQYFSCVSMITDVCRRVCPAVSPFAATQFCVSTSDTCINVSIWYSICLTFLFLLLCFAPLLLSSLPSFARFFLPSFLPQCQFSKRLNETVTWPWKLYRHSWITIFTLLSFPHFFFTSVTAPARKPDTDRLRRPLNNRSDDGGWR